jgi:hypothetical protein
MSTTESITHTLKLALKALEESRPIDSSSVVPHNRHVMAIDYVRRVLNIVESLRYPIQGGETKEVKSFLEEAVGLVKGQRQQDYGDRKKNFSDIAALWSVVLGKTIDPVQVAQCMVAMKLARLMKTPTHRDSWVDIAGYVACAEELLQPSDDDME